MPPETETFLRSLAVTVDAIYSRLAKLTPVFESLDLRLAVLEQGLETTARDTAQVRHNVHRLLSVAQAQITTLEFLLNSLDVDTTQARKDLQDAIRERPSE